MSGDRQDSADGKGKYIASVIKALNCEKLAINYHRLHVNDGQKDHNNLCLLMQ